MSAKNPAEQIKIASFDSTWPRPRAILLFLLGMEENPVFDPGPVEEAGIELVYPLLRSDNFDFDVFFEKS